VSDARTLPFSTRRDCEVQIRACIAASRLRLQLFDPDFAVFALGASSTDTALRAFLAGGGTLQLAMHSGAYIERHYPRFLRLLRDYGHRVECRLTPRSLRTLTDSFCIGDDVHIVRRFHSDHLRGEAAFDVPDATEIARERFAAIWAESGPGVHAATTGL
jgi:hypothetical protein